MTKAVRVHEYGGPEVLTLEDVELPAPGKGEVLIRQRAIGLNFLDIYHRTGLYKQPSMPFTPGSEGAGDVVAVGAGVTHVKPGDRVAYGQGIGAYAEERIVPAANLVKLAKEVSYEQAASMMLKGFTAQYLLRQTFKVKPGHIILVHAAAGGVGQILCQWGKALGATVIATVGSEDKAKIAKKVGAKHVILYRSEDVAAAVRKFTKGAMCDVVYDGVGKDTFIASLDSLKPRGLMVTFGNASGPVEGVNLGILSAKGALYLTRPTLAHYAKDAATTQAMARDLMKVVADKTVKIPINHRYRLADVAEAHRALAARETTGTTVIIP